MAVDTEYLDELMKSIEPIVYPDGDVPTDDEDDEQDMQELSQDEEFPESAGEEVTTEPVIEQIDYDPITVDDKDGSYDTDAGETETDSYEEELSQIPEKSSANQPTESELEVAAALEAISDPVEEEPEQKPVIDHIEEPVEIKDVDEANWEDINGEKDSIGEEIELDMSMSEEEIDAMLNAAKASAKEDSNPSMEEADVKDVLDMLGEDEDIRDIKDTLEKSDNNIAVDQSALDEPEIVIPNPDEEEEDKEEQDSPKSKKREKKKKEKAKKEPGEKKPGLLARLFNALTEEAEEDQVVIPEQAETGVTDENAKILSELDAEEDPKKKRKKKKKKKGKEEKQQPESEGNERDIREKPEDAGEEGEGSEGKGKKKKKPRKEKKPKEKKEEIPEKPGKKLPKKRVRNTFILCLSLLAGIVILAVFLNEYLLKKQARFAYDNADYETAYSDLYGMELDEEDQDIYNKSQTIMLLQRKVSSYENYMQLGMKKEALNALLEGYDMYPAVYERAERYGVTGQVQELYANIRDGLGSFGLSDEDAEEICGYTSAVQYNLRLESIANGTPYEYDEVSPDPSGEPESTEETISGDGLEDILPEEEDFLPENPEDIF